MAYLSHDGALYFKHIWSCSHLYCLCGVHACKGMSSIGMPNVCIELSSLSRGHGSGCMNRVGGGVEPL